MSDYKEKISELAEQIAEQKYQRAFSELPMLIQHQVWSQACRDYMDGKVAAFEALQDARQDR